MKLAETRHSPEAIEPYERNIIAHIVHDLWVWTDCPIGLVMSVPGAVQFIHLINIKRASSAEDAAVS